MQTFFYHTIYSKMAEKSNNYSGKDFKRGSRKSGDKKVFKKDNTEFGSYLDRKGAEKQETGNRGGRRTESSEKPRSGRSYGREDKRNNRGGFATKKPSLPQLLRLNRYISNSGICSRREADELIAGGYVTVNGEKVTEMGIKVSYNDQIKVRGKLIMPEKKVYVLLNKPKDYITTLDDPYAKKTVVQLVREACPERIYPVGRLDKNTTGVLLFTNDGELAKKLTHPSSNVPKIYQVQLDKPLTKVHLREIASGITLDDGPVELDEINYIDDLDTSQVGVRLHSGRNRIVRRIFEHFGYKVKKLDRVFFAGLTKKNLPRAKWRFLSDKEITRLKMNIFE